MWAIINNEKETGATAHLMTEGCDEGDIVLQQKIEITSTATGAELLVKFNSTYPELINTGQYKSHFFRQAYAGRRPDRLELTTRAYL